MDKRLYIRMPWGTDYRMIYTLGFQSIMHYYEHQRGPISLPFYRSSLAFG